MTKRMIAAALLLGLLLVACAAPKEDGAFQMLADQSEAAKEYAQEEFTRYMLSNGWENYTIELTTWGFDTAEASQSVYMVAFRYTAGEASGKYGYKIRVEADGGCSVVDEGTEVANILLGAETE